MATKRFDVRFNFLMSTAEFEMLEALASRDGLTPSDVLRRLVRREHAAVYGEPAAKPGKTRKRK